MDKESKIAALQEIIQEYNLKITELQAARSAVERALMWLTRTNGQLEIDEFVTAPKSGQIGPTEAVKGLFDSNPSKRWSARELRDKLEQMKNEGKLVTNARDLLTTVHWLLLDFVNKEYIEKYGARHKATYRKKVL
ncbi:MAG: hypothetical protein ACETWG_06745 [Candidatus Neomarinimicrobiota bacterium]